MKYLFFIPFSIFVFILIGCSDDAIPKPYGNLRLEYPEPNYIEFLTDCPYTFEFSDLIHKKPKDSLCAYDLYYPDIKATIYLSYQKVDSGNLIALIRDAEKSVYEPHTTKAEYIEPRLIVRPNDNVFGTLYALGGESAMNYQFHVTDSTKNFLRGSVYFRSHPKPDSLSPALDYLLKDVEHLMESIVWK